MKLYNARKGLLIAGMSSCLGLSACGNTTQYQQGIELQNEVIQNDEVNTEEETTQKQEETATEQVDNIYYTDSYYVIHLNDNIYITTCKDGDYYDVKTKELVGTILGKDKTDGRIVYSEGGQVNKEYDASFQDNNWYNGEYGYGHIIPKYACFALASVFDKETMNQEEFDFFTSNSDEVKEYIRSIKYYNKWKTITGYTVYSWCFFSRSTTQTEEVPLTKYVCTKQDGESDEFLGYRCSNHNADTGYNMVYDTLTGTIHYIGTKRPNSYVDVQSEAVDNSEHRTIQKMREMYGIDTKNVLKKEEIENERPIKYYEENSLYILDAKSEAVYLGDSDKQYYLLTLNSASLSEDETIYDIYNFSEVNNNHSFAMLDITDGKFNLSYRDSEEDILLILSGDSSSSVLMDINRFLTLNGYDDLVKENGEYSVVETSAISNCVEELNRQVTFSKK